MNLLCRPYSSFTAGIVQSSQEPGNAGPVVKSMAIVGFVIFDVLVVTFFLWCLANFIREDRRYKGANVKVTRLDPLPLPSAKKVFRPDEQTFSRRARRERLITAGESLPAARFRRG
jgi:hypothetical protein